MNELTVLQASHISNLTPPPGYGGIELIVDLLARYLISMGVRVHVMGVRNPHTNLPYHFINVFEKPVKSPSIKHKAKYVTKLLRHSIDVNVVHIHVQWLSIVSPLLRLLGKPTLLTLHADIRESLISQVVKRFNVWLVAVSYTQKRRMEARGFRVRDVVHHGIEVEKYPFLKEKDDYLVYLGRIDHSKGTHIAVRVAKRAGERLVIIGPIADKEYFKYYVEPYVDNHNIIYVGEVDFNTKVKYLSKAKAMLYPVQY